MPWALVVLAVLSQAQSPQIKAAQEAMDDLRYTDARTLLQKARQQPNLPREQLVEILWLQGLVAATLNQADAARSAFRALFAIDPEHRPERDYPPKIMSPYYEARGWIATTKPLGFARLPAELAAGRVKRIGVKVQADPLALVTSVRIHVVGGETTEHTLQGLTATRDVDAESVSWWAELIGERNAQLARVGDEKEPLVDSGKVVDASAALAPAPVPVVEDPAMNPLRSGAYAAAGVGIASFGLGLIFGIRSNTMRQALLGRTYDENGVVAGGWTQRESVGLELQQRREAGVANAMFFTAVLLVGAAVALYILGAP